MTSPFAFSNYEFGYLYFCIAVNVKPFHSRILKNVMSPIELKGNLNVALKELGENYFYVNFHKRSQAENRHDSTTP